MGSIMKKELEKKAKELRKEGYSINELKGTLNVSKSTISRWVADIKLSNEAQVRIDKNYSKGQLASQKTIKEKTRLKNFEADNFAINKLKDLNINSDCSLLLCSMLYQCEGSKYIKDPVTFTNSGPELIGTFLHLFRKSFVLEEDKFRVLMHLHGYHNEKTQKKFWSKITGIPMNQFLKTYNKPNTGIYKKDGYQGCIQVRYHNVKIGRIINAVAKKFMERYK
jgi:transposase